MTQFIQKIQSIFKKDYTLYFVVSLLILSAFYIKGFQGLQGDGIYYYSTAVSIVWDKDLDLRNQYDYKLQGAHDQTVANRNYYVDAKTGKVFTLFNPGTGVLMVPLLVTARIIDMIRGNPHSDPFSHYYQFFAGYTGVLFSAIAMLLLFLMLKRFYSYSAAIILPVIFIGGTNWLFYTVAFAGWAHVFALSLILLLSWFFLRFMEKNDTLSALLFGLTGGILFSTRNLDFIYFLLLCFYILYHRIKEDKSQFIRKNIYKALVIIFFFLIGTIPQLLVNYSSHGNMFITPSHAAVQAIKPFGFLENKDFSVFRFENLAYLYSALFNSDNGLFRVHLLFLLGFIGALFLRYKTSPFNFILSSLLIVTTIFWFLDTAFFDFWFNHSAGAGFGHRRFIDFIPLFVFGVANLSDIASEKKSLRLILNVLISILFASGLTFFYYYMFSQDALYVVKYSITRFYAFLIFDFKTLFIFAVAFPILVILTKKRETSSPVSLNYKSFIAIMCLIYILPLFIFRASPQEDRQKFLIKKGFFVMYNNSSLVDLPGNNWALPKEGKRQLLTHEGKIILPAPLKNEDIVLFKIETLQNSNIDASIRIKAQDYVSQKLPLLPRIQYYSFKIDKPLKKNGKEIEIIVTQRTGPMPLIYFYEGRVILRESHEPPFGGINIPKEENINTTGNVVFGGWALDDRKIKWVLIQDVTIPGNERVIGEAEFLEGWRPDIEKIFVLYPQIHRAAWKFEFNPYRYFSPGSTQLKLKVIAVNSEGLQVVLGTRRIIGMAPSR